MRWPRIGALRRFAPRLCVLTHAAIRNAQLHVSIWRAFADLQARDFHSRRVVSAETADRLAAFISERTVGAACVPQFSFMLPALAIVALLLAIPRIGAPGTHVRAVVAT